MKLSGKRWSPVGLGLGILAMAALAGIAAGPNGGSTTTEAAQVDDSLPDLATQVAFPNLRFERPVVMAWPDDDSDLLFVCEQGGVIYSFPADRRTDDRQVFLDLRPPKVNRQGNEEGLLGLAFHPDYAENGEFFVYYSAIDPRSEDPGRRSVVSRFRVSEDDPRRADPDSEEVVWVSDKDPFNNHNGGCIEFGPDGFLYISLGDSGAANDPLNTGQDPSDFWGSILRVDVDNPSDGKPYGIPADNPALRDPDTFGRWAPEVFAIGLRNVWKFTFDRETGEIWAGDVGQNLWEEVDVIVNGGNYGWSHREGFHPFVPGLRRRGNPADRASTPFIEPVAEYPHATGQQPTPDRTDTGLSVTGGYVYRGEALPDLVGTYVYADYETGRIWGVRRGEEGTAVNGELIDLGRNGQPALKIAGFGEDRDGELFLLAFDGRIHELAPVE